jgi:cytochrome c oxidase assembly protein subunit 11
MNQSEPGELARKNIRTGLIVLGAVFGMTALSFASVPLYTLFCKITGFGGTTQVSQTLPAEILERRVRLNFNADTAPGLPWNFRPEKRGVELRVGAQGLMVFEAQNKAAKSFTGTALYNVTPLKAGKYFHKTQCFCFDAQTLNPGEKASFPVVFYIDPAMASDPNMDEVETITLSYTFFPADSKALESALEKFYAQNPRP